MKIEMKQSEQIEKSSTRRIIFLGGNRLRVARTKKIRSNFEIRFLPFFTANFKLTNGSNDSMRPFSCQPLQFIPKLPIEHSLALDLEILVAERMTRSYFS
jgi:hypothetical protein